MSLKLLVRGVQETTKTIKAIIVFLDCLPEVETKFLLPKPPHTLDTGFAGPEKDLT